jgi:hypothetical protein
MGGNGGPENFGGGKRAWRDIGFAEWPAINDEKLALYPQECRGRLGRERNFAPAWCVENADSEAQVELESWLTGGRVKLAGRTIAPGKNVSHIQVLRDARRTRK